MMKSLTRGDRTASYGIRLPNGTGPPQVWIEFQSGSNPRDLGRPGDDALFPELAVLRRFQLANALTGAQPYYPETGWYWIERISGRAADPPEEDEPEPRGAFERSMLFGILPEDGILFPGFDAEHAAYLTWANRRLPGLKMVLDRELARLGLTIPLKSGD